MPARRKRSYRGWRDDRPSIDENQVDAYAEARSLLCKEYRLIVGGRVRHQRGRRDDAGSVGLDNGAIHPGSQAKIVGVDDQSSHRQSLAGKRDTAATMLYDVDSFHGMSRSWAVSSAG